MDFYAPFQFAIAETTGRGYKIEEKRLEAIKAHAKSRENELTFLREHTEEIKKEYNGKRSIPDILKKYNVGRYRLDQFLLELGLIQRNIRQLKKGDKHSERTNND